MELNQLQGYQRRISPCFDEFVKVRPAESCQKH